MELKLSKEQLEFQNECRAFVNQEVIPFANKFDKEQYIPVELIRKIASRGCLSATIPKKYGGSELDMITLGLLHEEFGRGYASVQNIITVFGMASQGIVRFGTKEQKQKWLPKIASGETIAAFALTEPNIGSNINRIETTYTEEDEAFVLNGRKKWTTLGQIADLFLVFAQCNNVFSAFLVENGTPGFTIKHIEDVLGLRGNMLAELEFNGCRIPKSNIVGKQGIGISQVAAFSLDLGRYTTAWGCIGLGQACLEASLNYVGKRKQFGVYLKEHQLIQKMITDMIVDVKAARLVCFNAGYLRETCDPQFITETLIAKYYASTMVNKVAGNAVQIHGANGCSSDYHVQRCMRDAKIMEIIEGATQIYETQIALSILRGLNQ